MSSSKKDKIKKREIEEEEHEEEENEEMEDEEEVENAEENEEENEEEGEEGEEEEEIEGKNEKEEKPEEEEEEEELAPIDAMNLDMAEINIRIQKIVEILSDFKNKKDPNRSRNDYINELKQYLMQYYDYNEEICNLIMNLFPPNEAVEFMEANNTQKLVTIRTNTLKTKRRELAKTLISRNINLDPLAEWTKVGLKIISSSVPIGATPEYLAGHYMLQSPSSFLPVIALDPQPGEKILDMCASPGGKATYIAQLMKNSGILVANDMKKERIKSLFFNIHRLGIKNSIITNYDARNFPKFYNSFDRILLDAPCSGLGVIAKDQSVKVNRTYKEVLNNSRVQKELILAAIDSCNVKGSGIIVYSTCSIAVEENEWVVDYALKHRYVKCIETGFEIGEPGLTSFREKHFHTTLKNTRRIYPHIHNMDGFYVAKLKKYADGVKKKEENKKDKNQKKKGKKKNQNELEEDEEDNDEKEDENVQHEIEINSEDSNNVGDDEENDGIFIDEEDEKDFDDSEEIEKAEKKQKNTQNMKKNKKDKINRPREVKKEHKREDKKQKKESKIEKEEEKTSQKKEKGKKEKIQEKEKEINKSEKTEKMLNKKRKK